MYNKDIIMYVVIVVVQGKHILGSMSCSNTPRICDVRAFHTTLLSTHVEIMADVLFTGNCHHPLMSSHGEISLDLFK